jgi:hypothetical protein
MERVSVREAQPLGPSFGCDVSYIGSMYCASSSSRLRVAPAECKLKSGGANTVRSTPNER